MGFLRRVAQQAYHLANHTKLHAMRLDGEQHSTDDKGSYKDVGPQHIIYISDRGVEPTVG